MCHCREVRWAAIRMVGRALTVLNGQPATPNQMQLAEALDEAGRAHAATSAALRGAAAEAALNGWVSWSRIEREIADELSDSCHPELHT